MPYHNFYLLIEEKLGTIFSRENNHPPELYEPQEYILSLGGKRLRPLLVLIGNDLFEGNLHKAIPAAVCMELFHNFSLIHDDILDKAPLRRNQKTVHKKWNTNIAILSGDALLVKAYEELGHSDAAHLGKLLQLFSRTALEVCEGQQEDMNFETKNYVPVKEYEAMIRKKTAVLLACCLKSGAITAGAKEADAEHLYRFGLHIGIAFQLKDDILDVYANGKDFGKQEAGDILSNKKTFLLLKALELANAKHLQELEYWLVKKEFDAEEKVNAVKKIYDKLNVHALAEKEVLKHFTAGLVHLEKVRCGKKKKEQLEEFSKELMKRMK
jgi:geranylgeranyl diphosphate synthase, type II